MEAILLASSALLAYQYKTQMTVGAPTPDDGPDVSPEEIAKIAQDKMCADALGPRQLREYTPEEIRQCEDRRNAATVSRSVTTNEDSPHIAAVTNYQPTTHYYNHNQGKQRNHPINVSIPPSTAVPRYSADRDMMIEEFRLEKPSSLSMGGGAGGVAYRPSWMRAGDMVPQRQERDMPRSIETPRMADGRIQGFYDQYRNQSVQTLNQKNIGGLPFDEQLREIPQGWDPVATQRAATARYNKYALGDDLTQYAPDGSTVRGQAYGQHAGRDVTIQQDGFEIMPNRDVQLMSASAGNNAAPLGSGVRGGGRGGALGSFLGAAGPQVSKSELEWDMGATGQRNPVDAPVLRPGQDAAKHVGEEIQTFPHARGANPRPDVLKGTASTASDKTAWKFSFDVKKLFDMKRIPDLRPDTIPKKHIPKTEQDPTNTKVSFDVKQVFDMKREPDRRPETIPNKHIPKTEQDPTNTRVSYDVKEVFELKRVPDTRPETDPVKPVLMEDADRTRIRVSTSEQARKETNFKPKAKGTGFKQVSNFKHQDETPQLTSAIRTQKRMSVEQSMPLGKDMMGKTVPIPSSSVDMKRRATDDGILYDNDKIFERGGILTEPKAAPKSDQPDYTLEKINSMRSSRGEFRKR